MLTLTRRVADADAAARGPLDEVALDWHARTHARQRLRLESGREASLVLPRGSVLRDGDLLAGDSGPAVRVRAAAEDLSEVACSDPLQLARACYHLGNRHVALQIAPGCVRYARDHVLDDMLRGLGLVPRPVRAPFQPEAGAYGGHAHGHGHGYNPGEDPGHGHEPAPDQPARAPGTRDPSPP